MADGVHQDLGLIEHLQSMADQASAKMAKEGLGLMTSIGL